MYSVMIVDDDSPMLEFLRQLLPWSELELDLREAQSADEALNLQDEQPADIVVTDIGMPGMSGIELVQLLRTRKPGIRVIFLTCHEDFHYVKKALQLEADDYLIKDELTADKLEESLRKATERLKESELRLNELAYRQDVERNKDVLRQAYLHDLIHGRLHLLPASQAKRVEVDWTSPWFQLVLVHIDAASYLDRYRYDDFSIVSYAVCNIAQEIAVQREHIVEAFLYKESSIVLVSNHTDVSGERMLPLILEYLKDVADKCEHYLGIKLSFAVNRRPREAKGVGSVYGMLSKPHGVRYYDPDRIFIWDESLRERRAGMEQGDQLLAKCRGQLEEAARRRDTQLVNTVLFEYRQKAIQYSLAPVDVMEACVEFVRSTASVMNVQVEESFYSFIRGTRSITETIDFTCIAIQGTGLASERQPEDPELEQINWFIDRRMHETITSIDMAHHLQLNPSYFSRYFKQLAGITFTDYVHQYKMRIAMSLLRQPEETVENVAFTLGYSDRTYFSKVFKKYNDISPSDFRLQEAVGEKERMK